MANNNPADTIPQDKKPESGRSPGDNFRNERDREAGRMGSQNPGGNRNSSSNSNS